MPNAIPYGFYRLADLENQRISEVGVSRVETAVRQSIDEHNRNLNAMLNVFVRKTTDYKIKYSLPGATRLQLGDEDGRARKVKTFGQYEVGFPLRHFMIAWGANWVTRKKMTVAQAAAAVNTLLSADTRTVRDGILISLFDNTGYTFADPVYGNLAVKGLANSDSVVYNVITGADTGTTDSHFLAQTGAAITLATVQANYTELTEHPENGGEVVMWVPSNQRSAVEAMTGFVPKSDSNVQLGTAQNQLVGSPPVAGPGEVFGYVGHTWMYEWRQLPSDYCVSIATEGEKPLAMREDPETDLRGFRPAEERNDFPYWENQYVHRFGIGAWNRVGATVIRINNASYAIPTGLTNLDIG